MDKVIKKRKMKLRQGEWVFFWGKRETKGYGFINIQFVYFLSEGDL